MACGTLARRHGMSVGVALCVVRTQPCRDKYGRRCFQLLTLRSSIEAVELED